jgi:hypothetical protein
LTLVIMMAVRPEGLLPNERRRMELHEAEFEQGGPESKPGSDAMDAPPKSPTAEPSMGRVE